MDISKKPGKKALTVKENKVKKWILWIIVGVIVALGGVGLGSRFFFSKNEEPRQQASLVAVERGDIQRIISAMGFLSSQGSQEVKFSKQGRIKEIVVQEGDYVEEGETLAKLEGDKERLSLLQAENALKEAESELESAKLGSPKSVVEKKERQLREKKLELQLKRKELEDTLLKAPFSGMVSKIYVEKGEIVSGEAVSASRAILRLIDTSRLFAEVAVDEVDIAQARLGQRTEVTVDAYPDEIFSGRVVYVAPEATTSQGLVVIEVKIELEKADPRLKPGFTASADIITDEAKDVLVLPVEAVHETPMGSFVVVSEEGGSTQRRVALGVSDGTNVEIKSGLEEGEMILSSGLQRIIEERRMQREGEGQRPGGMPGRMRLPVPH
ncbi:efflux RND transporter periplasmic adaptor subunit [Candidatus Aerophobetes bacterium]|uniref:Efflux RND transporter periplasmic adaptor subunit n=1 Tax=Aerophobetes bacterium TaxID=2030807 RepID=A0A523UNI9_UNCAE|nr:MAG: efflux RND transporter periplasmic adaptor subunit [Candidatus Aerophobetes bacterium]